ncbi:MAG: SPOR domain-containing protein [Candidatus Bruticola sp.]
MNINVFRSMRLNIFAAVALLSILVGSMNMAARPAVAAEPETKNSGYAVLIVGDESKPDMARSEKELISEITKLLVEKDDKGAYKYSRARAGMQVFSYHINHDREKQFCEKKLNILGEDLLFLGVIALNDRLPSKVIYRVDRIVNEKRAAAEIFNYAEELLAGGALPAVKTPAKSEPAVKKPAAANSDADKKNTSVSKPAVSAPAAPATSSSTAAVRQPASGTVSASQSSAQAPSSKKYPPVPEGKYLSCQVGAFSNEANAKELVDDLKAKGYEAAYRKFERSGGSFFYRVYSGSFSTRADAESALRRLKDHGFDKAILVTLDK